MSGYGDKADCIIYDLEQRVRDLASEVEYRRAEERRLMIRIEELEVRGNGDS